jgi:hypothetical protein
MGQRSVVPPLASLAATLSVLFLPSPAGASPSDSERSLRDDETTMTRGQAEFGMGLLTLPGAEVCVERSAGCTKGDNSIIVTAQPMFRRGNFAVGAGVMLGLTSSSDAPRNDPPDVPRDHWRRYYAVEVTGRYYVPLTESLDGWVGITTGLGVVSDTFQSQKGLTELALVGPRGLVIITEGGTLGLGIGLTHAFSENWLLGGRLRVSEWFLPTAPARDPLGDEASLKGIVTMLDLGVTLAYRSRLVF